MIPCVSDDGGTYELDQFVSLLCAVVPNLLSPASIKRFSTHTYCTIVLGLFWNLYRYTCERLCTVLRLTFRALYAY